MRHLTRIAPSPLDRFIEFLWYWEGDPTGHLKDAIVASAHAGMLINLADDRLNWYDGARFSVSHRLRGIGISGPHSRTFGIDAFHRKMMGVQFRAGGAYPFFGHAMHEIADRHIALEDVWGADAERLHQRLVEAPEPAEKFDILQHALMEKARDNVVHDSAARHALRLFARPPHRTTVAAAARETGLSQKKLIRVFSEQVGLRPKLYLRVARFQRALSQIASTFDVDWGDIVEQNGYYDQSHFIRDFGQFSALAPGAYLKRRGPYLQHVPLPA
jgi:AraC-like DNA-binding protein